jgi:hypothetical protein
MQTPSNKSKRGNTGCLIKRIEIYMYMFREKGCLFFFFLEQKEKKQSKIIK